MLDKLSVEIDNLYQITQAIPRIHIYPKIPKGLHCSSRLIAIHYLLHSVYLHIWKSVGIKLRLQFKF